jgi:hypothetical protein
MGRIYIYVYMIHLSLENLMHHHIVFFYGFRLQSKIRSNQYLIIRKEQA